MMIKFTVIYEMIKFTVIYELLTVRILYFRILEAVSLHDWKR